MNHSSLKRVTLGLLALLIASLTFLSAVPAEAATPAHDQKLPPLPEWPVIGPVLKFLGITRQEPDPEPVQPTPDPSLPEYSIETTEDLAKLRDIEANQSVRVTATEDALNQMIKETLDANTSREASMVMSVQEDAVSLMIEADTQFIKETGQNIPGLNADTVSIDATLDVNANQCVPFVHITAMEVNRWSFGLRSVAQRTINARITEIWPDDLCLEGVFFTPGLVSIEGYRRP